MYMVVIGGKDRLVNTPYLFLGVLRLLCLPFEEKEFSFSIPGDRWDKEFFEPQVG